MIVICSNIDTISLQINVGLLQKNENINADMVDLLNEYHSYSKTHGKTLLVGEYLPPSSSMFRYIILKLGAFFRGLF